MILTFPAEAVPAESVRSERKSAGSWILSFNLYTIEFCYSGRLFYLGDAIPFYRNLSIISTASMRQHRSVFYIACF